MPYSWKEPLLRKESSERMGLNLKANLCTKGEGSQAHFDRLPFEGVKALGVILTHLYAALAVQ